MHWVLRLVVFSFVLALLVFGFLHFFPTPEQQILSKVNQMARLASYEAGAGQLVHLAAVTRFVDEFLPEAVVQISSMGVGSRSMNGREEIRQVALAARQRVEAMSVDIVDPLIQLSDGENSAFVEATVKVIQLPARELIVMELRFSFTKKDHQWRVSRIASISSIQR